jgi:hypothetical protein
MHTIGHQLIAISPDTYQAALECNGSQAPIMVRHGVKDL